MYITKLKLKNIRCFDKFEINFDKPGSSILILGDNGDGKSTILKCIAMGLCDESSAAALFRELPGEFVRRKPGEKEVETGRSGTIEIDLAGKDDWTYRITTRIVSLETFERVTQSRRHKSILCRFRGKKKELLTQDTFPWDEIFVSGYGAGIRVQGTADFQHYLAVDAVYPLFKYDEPLQNPELVIRRLVEAARGIRRDPKMKSVHAGRVLDTVEILLAHLLNLKKNDQIYLTPTGIKVKGRWGIAELGELGDGYRATVTWVLDLLAWWFLKAKRKAKLNVTDIRGIVLFDEIEQHLHPRWQRTILQLLQESFPRVQFIATTHSPLVASGSEAIAVHTLQSGNHRIEKPYGWSAEGVYSMMGLNNTRTKGFTSKVLDKYEDLLQKQLQGNASHRDLLEIKQLKRELASFPESDPVSLTTEIMSITNSLRKLSKKGAKK